MPHDIKKFLQEENLNLFQLVAAIALDHGVPIEEDFPVNKLGIVYFLTVYSLKNKKLAYEALADIRPAFKFINSLDGKVESGTIELKILKKQKEKKYLEKKIPRVLTRFLIEEILTRSLGMYLDFIKSYRYKAENDLKFTSGEIDLYLKLKSADAFLYVGILTYFLDKYLFEIQNFLYQLQQLNDAIDDIVDFEKDLKEGRENWLFMIQNLDDRKGSVLKTVKTYLSKKTKQVQNISLPSELDYLLEFPKILEGSALNFLKKNQKLINKKLA